MFAHRDTHKARMRLLPPAKIPGAIVILSVLLASRGPAPAQAAGGIHYAKPGALQTNTCLSWAQACDLQSALTWPVDTAPGEVWVARGVYVPTAGLPGGGPRSKTFLLPNGVSVYGGFVGTETDRSERDPRQNVTVLSGDLGTVGEKSDNA